MLIIAEEGGRRNRQVHRHAGLVLEGLPAQGQGQGLQILVSDYIAVHDFGTSAAPLKAAGSTFKVRMVSRQLLSHACDRWC